jgi:hypothetical protein
VSSRIDRRVLTCRLKDALQDAAQYRPLYEDLMDEHEIMLSREAMAIDEAERVGQQNVELMGSVSGGQKIGYIDALRREAAAVKHVRDKLGLSLG